MVNNYQVNKFMSDERLNNLRKEAELHRLSSNSKTAARNGNPDEAIRSNPGKTKRISLSIIMAYITNLRWGSPAKTMVR